MSKSLSANVTAGKDGGAIPVWLLEVESSTTTYRWSTLGTADFPTAWTGTAFVGNRLKARSFSKVVHSCDVTYGGNVAEVGGFGFKLANGDLYSDTLATQYFENRRVELRLIFADKTSPSWANASPVFLGATEHVGWDHNAISFQTKGKWLTIHKAIPDRFLSQDDISELPDSLHGVALPIIYGDFSRGNGINKSGLASNLSPGSNQVIHRDYVQGYVLWKQRQVVLAGHDCHTPWIANQDTNRERWDPVRKCWVRFAGRADFQRWGDNLSGMMTRGLVTYGETHYVDLVPVVDTTNTSGATDPTYAVDEDDTNGTVLNANNEIAAYEIPSYFGKRDTFSDVKLKYWVDRSGHVDDNCQIQVLDSLGGVITGYSNIGTFGSMVSLDLDSLHTFTGDYTGYMIRFKFARGGAGDETTYTIRAVFFEITESDSTPGDVLHAPVKGRMYQTEIDAPNFSNALNAGDLIESAPMAVLSILANELDVQPASRSGAVLFNQAAAIPGPAYRGIKVRHSTELALGGAAGAGTFSMSCWVYVTQNPISTVMTIAQKATGGVANGFRWVINSDGTVIFYVGNGTNEGGVATVGTVAPNTWTHLGVRYTGAQLYLTLQGVADGAGSPAYLPTDGGGVIDIGGDGVDNTTNKMVGRIDELVIFDGDIGTQKLIDDYASGAGVYHTPTNTANMIACWHFDAGAGNEFWDASGMGNHAYYGVSSSHGWAAGKVVTAQGLSETTFDALHTNKANWKIARDVLEPRNSRDLIREICYEFGFAQFPRYDGLECVSRIDAVGAPATITTASVLMRGNDTTFKVSRARITDVKNEFILHYQENYATGDFDKTLYVKNPGARVYKTEFTNLASSGQTYWEKCRDVFLNIKQVNRWEYKAKWIRDDATAELFLKFMIDKLSRRPYIVEFDAPLSLIDLELLDVRKIAHPLLPAAIDSTNHFRLIGQEIDPNEDLMSLTWLDVGTP